MIRILRGAAPEVLTTKGVAARQALCAQVDRDGDEYPLKFDGRIYRHTSVHQELYRMQHGKCCYCERSLDRGTIDHYRPKGAVYQNPGDRVSTRGYYWLAYTWENLLLACSECNTRFKRELFPLADPAVRVWHHSGAEKLPEELPLLLDPTLDDPEEHISFRAFTPVARTRRGRETINTLHLDSAFLETQRERILSSIETLCVILDVSRRGMAVAEEILHGVCETMIRYSEVTQAHRGMIWSTLRLRFGSEIELPFTYGRLLAWAQGRDARPL